MFRLKNKSNVPCSILENFWVNTALVIGLLALDAVSIFNFSSDLMTTSRPEVIKALAATFVVLIDVGAIVLGYNVAKYWRRQTLMRMSNYSLVVCILIGVGFLTGMRILSKDLIFDGGSADIGSMFGDTGVDAESGGLSPALKILINVFLAIQIVGTAAIAFSLSALRSNYKKLLIIESLERKVAKLKALLQYQVNLRDAGFSALTEEKAQEHSQLYDMLSTENQELKHKVLSEFTLETGINWLRSDLVDITPAPTEPYISDEAAELFNQPAPAEGTAPAAAVGTSPETAVIEETKAVFDDELNQFSKEKDILSKTFTPVEADVTSAEAESTTEEAQTAYYPDELYEEDI